MNGACPEPEMLKSYASGTLSEDQVSHVELHLSSCSVCAEATGEFADQPDDFIGLLRESASVKPTAVLRESEFLSAVDFICQRQFAEAVSHPIARTSTQTGIDG